MKIWQRLFLGLLVIAGLVLLVTSVSISVSGHVTQLRHIELPMEQNLREVEVSIWETIHAANAFRSAADPYYSELYSKQVKDVDEYFTNYTSITDSPSEDAFADEFRLCWRQAQTSGKSLLDTVRREKAADDRFFSLVDRADDVIDHKIQARLSASDPNVLAKEQALREVEVSIWEAIHAGLQYTGLTQNITRAGHAQNTFAELMQRQFGEVDEFWSKYKALATSDAEKGAIREFEDLWRQAVDCGNNVVLLHDQASEHFESLYAQVDTADAIIDFKMQAYIQKRIQSRDESASRAKTMTTVTALVAVIGATVTCFLLAGSIVGPISGLSLAASEFGKGNFQHRIACRRKDELGDLARALDRMGSELENFSDRLAQEIMERKQAEEIAREAKEYLETALAQSPSGIVIADAPDLVVRLANQAARNIFAEDLMHTDLPQHADQWQAYYPDGSPYPPDELPLSRAACRGETVQNEELIIRDKEGNDHWLNASAAPLRDTNGQVTAGIVVFHDVSERKKMLAKMQKLAFQDALTGLPNRTSLLRALQEVIDRGDDTQFALLFVDLDRFKLVNDSLGHDVGDTLLKKVAYRLQETLRASDEIITPARLGGDEFVVLLDNLSRCTDAMVVAERLLEVLSERYELGGHTVHSTASIGVVTSEHPFQSACEVLRDADLAMYESKAAGKACVTVFDRTMRENNQRRHRIENEMRDAISRDEFVVFYQPIISLKTGQIVGAEALLRWMNPQHGMIGPDEFIPVAEDTGMIIPIGNAVINEACQDLARWHSLQRDEQYPLGLHINVSRKQLLVPSLVGVVQQALAKHSVPASCVHLEVTESSIMEDPETVKVVLNELRQLGVKIDIDDFGTGHSSLSCIHEFPIDVLKIDRAFIRNLEETSESMLLLQVVLTLADNLNMPVVAEGIEDEQQLDLLREIGCEFGQGFLFAKPMPSEEFEDFLSLSSGVVAKAGKLSVTAS